MIDLLLVSMFPAAMALAAASDLFTMTISNRLSIGLVAAFGVAAAASGLGADAILMHLSAGFCMLAIAFVLFSFGWIGGGDAKLFAATAVWMGWPHLVEYVVWTGLIGGALTLALLVVRQVPLPAGLQRQTWMARLHAADTGVPYGIALAAAGLVVYPHTEWMALLSR